MELQLHGLFKKSAVPETEWIEAIGILLDNAIEASPKGSTVYIAVRKKGTYLELACFQSGPGHVEYGVHGAVQERVYNKKQQ